MLKEIFDLQDALNLKYGIDRTGMNDAQLRQWFLNCCTALRQEVGEAMDSIGWKWWSCDLSKTEAMDYIIGVSRFNVSWFTTDTMTMSLRNYQWAALIARIANRAAAGAKCTISRDSEKKVQDVTLTIESEEICNAVDESWRSSIASNVTKRTAYYIRGIFDAIATLRVAGSGYITVEIDGRLSQEDAWAICARLYSDFNVTAVYDAIPNGNYGVYIPGRDFVDKVGFMHPDKMPSAGMLAPPDWQNVRLEIVDILHFLVSMALASGMTAEDLYRMYVQKNKVNHNRIESGYSTIGKTEDDNRSIT